METSSLTKLFNIRQEGLHLPKKGMRVMSCLGDRTQGSPEALYKMFSHYFIFKVTGSNYNANLTKV